jgi:hypothetical protein
MQKLVEVPQAVLPDLLSPPLVNTSVISISSQHMSCTNCDVESETVTSLTLKLSSADGVKEFTLPPASNIELVELAILFGTSHAFSEKIIFNTLPGFEVSFIRNSTNTVHICLTADSQLLNFMGLHGSCSSAQATIAMDELAGLESAIRSASAPCN